MSAYIEQFADHVDENGRRLVVRNGYQHELDTLTSGGTVAVKAPRVHEHLDPDTQNGSVFRPQPFRPWARETPQTNEMLPMLYLHGTLHQRLRFGTRAVPRIGCRAVGGLDQPVDDPVAAGG